MLKDFQIKERLNNMIGEELTSTNLAKGILFDKPKCLKRQLENYQAYVTYKITNTAEGPWAKIYLTGNPTEFRISLEKKDGKYYIKNVVNNEKVKKIIWVSWSNELAYGGDIIGYRNIHNNKIISKKTYDEMIEKEILKKWKDMNTEEKAEYDNFEHYRKNILEVDDPDFEPLVEFIINEDEDLEDYEPYIEMHWLEILTLEYNKTIYEIAKKSRIAKSTLYSIISRRTQLENITMPTLDAICQSLGITLIEFLYKYENRFLLY